ncbi:MAG TPA: hypothetical protein VH988_17615 [Thermoanaerobaculia bacterium]|jgi:hypothetical protein|nr:hypothetical protein [Thermoanaerobaculia bacterium]
MSRAHQTSRRTLTTGIAAGLLVLGLTATATALQDRTPLRLIAFAVNLNAVRPAAQANIVEIKIDRWSGDQERAGLVGALRSGGETAALSALQKTRPVGIIRTPDSVGWDLHYAHEVPTPDGGRNVYIATDRPIAFWEAANDTRSTHYPFTLIELHLDRNGKGEGRLTIATKATLNGDRIELENYSTQPVMLEQVHIEKK